MNDYQLNELKKKLMQTPQGMKQIQGAWRIQTQQAMDRIPAPISTPTKTVNGGAKSSSGYGVGGTTYDPNYQKPAFMTQQQKQDQINANNNTPYSDITAKAKKNLIALKMKTGMPVTQEEMDFYNGKTVRVLPHYSGTAQDFKINQNQQNVVENADVMSRSKAESTPTEPKYIDLPKTLTPQMIQEEAQKIPGSQFQNTMMVTDNIAQKWGNNWLPQLNALKNQGITKVMVPEKDKYVLMKIDDARTLHGATDTGENVVQRALDRANYNLTEHGLGTIMGDFLKHSGKEFLQYQDTLGSGIRNAIDAYQKGKDTKGIISQGVNGAWNSLNGNYADNMFQKQGNGNVYGTDLLNNAGWKMDPNQKWYSPNNLGHTITGLGIDIGSDLSPSAIEKKGVAKLGQVSAKASGKDLAYLKDVLTHWMPTGTNHEENALISSIKEKIDNLKPGDKIDFNPQQVVKELSDKVKANIMSQYPDAKTMTGDALTQFNEQVVPQLKSASAKNILSRNQDLLDQIKNLETMPVNHLTSRIPEPITNGVQQVLDKSGMSYLTNKMMNSTVGKKLSNGMENTAKALNKSWGVDPKVIQQARWLLGQKDLNQAQVMKELTDKFKNVDGETGKQLMYALSGLHEDPVLAQKFGADISKVPADLLQWAKDKLSNMSTQEGIANRTNYAPQFSSISQKQLNELWTKKEGELRQTMGDQYVNDILGATKKVNVHALEKSFQHPIEFAQYYADMKNIPLDQAVKDIGLVTDARTALARRLLDHEDIMANKNLNDYLTNQVGFQNASNDTRQFVDSFLKNPHPNDVNPLVKGYDAFNKGWKRAVMNMPILGGSASARNLYGGAVNNYTDMGLGKGMAGTGKYLEYRLKNSAQNDGWFSKLPDSVKQSWHLNNPISFSDGSSLTPQQVSDMFTQNLVNDAGYAKELENAKNIRNFQWNQSTAQQLANPLNWSKKIYGLGGKMNQGVENILRGSNMMDKLGQYGTSKMGVAQAAKDAESVHYNYNDAFQTNTEKNLKRFVPFYTFTRQNLPKQMLNMLEHPTRMNNVQYAKQELNQGKDPSRNDPNFPDYLKSSGIYMGDTNGDGKPNYANTTWLPTQDLADWLNPAQKVLSSLNPALKGFYDGVVSNTPLMSPENRNRQLGTGFDMSGSRTPLTGQDVGQFLLNHLPSVASGLGLDTNTKGQVTQNALKKSVIGDLSPLASRVGSIFDSYAKDQKNGSGSQNQIAQWLKSITGFGTTNPDVKQIGNIEMSRTLDNQQKTIDELTKANSSSAPTKAVQDQTLKGNYTKTYDTLQQSYVKQLNDYNDLKQKYESGNYQPTRKPNGFVYDVKGNVIDYVPKTKLQHSPEKMAEAAQKVADGQAKSKAMWDEFKQYYQNGNGNYISYEDWLRNRNIAIPTN